MQYELSDDDNNEDKIWVIEYWIDLEKLENIY